MHIIVERHFFNVFYRVSRDIKKLDLSITVQTYTKLESLTRLQRTFSLFVLQARNRVPFQQEGNSL